VEVGGWWLVRGGGSEGVREDGGEFGREIGDRGEVAFAEFGGEVVEAWAEEGGFLVEPVMMLVSAVVFVVKWRYLLACLLQDRL